MITPSSLHPDAELKELLEGNVLVGTDPIAVYSDWERPTNGLPSDFIVIFINGDIETVSKKPQYAQGYMILSLYCKMNDDGSIKANRVTKILTQFDALLDHVTTENYYFEYESPRFITPTTPNQSSGYSVTSLNLKWHTNNNFKTD